MTLYPDVLPTLSLLKDTYRLGLVTNGNTYSERCGLPGLFAFTIFAQDYQVPKPQPECYERVLSEMHTQPQEIIHVGDSLHNAYVERKQSLSGPSGRIVTKHEM